LNSPRRVWRDPFLQLYSFVSFIYGSWPRHWPALLGSVGRADNEGCRWTPLNKCAGLLSRFPIQRKQSPYPFDGYVAHATYDWRRVKVATCGHMATQRSQTSIPSNSATEQRETQLGQH
jgi:hypothetical protein